jgi:hypothetical protein
MQHAARTGTRCCPSKMVVSVPYVVEQMGVGLMGVMLQERVVVDLLAAGSGDTTGNPISASLAASYSVLSTDVSWDGIGNSPSED